jgi:CheY-like chemotaxis protein
VRLPARLVVALCPMSATALDRRSDSTTRHRVLVADDNHDAADSLVQLLQYDGHEVCVAYDGRHAVALAQTFRPTVAILDLGMPHLDGYQAAAQLRQAPWGADILLIAYTGWGHDSVRQRSKEASFDLHLIKPLDVAALSLLLSNTAINNGA